MLQFFAGRWDLGHSGLMIFCLLASFFVIKVC